MGLQDDILEAFYSKLSANEEIPEIVITKLKELFKSGAIERESILKILEGSLHYE